MKKLELKTRKLLRTIFGCISFTAVAFVFQACYGIEEDPFHDVKLTGIVKSKSTQLPIKGIEVAVNVHVNGFDNCFGYGMTNQKGEFDFYASVPNYNYYYHLQDTISTVLKPDSVRVYFFDIDGMENGSFDDKVIIINPAHKDEVKLYVELEEKQ